MTKNDKNNGKKRLVAIVLLLLLLGSAVIPLLDEMSKETPIRQQSTVIFSENIDLENKVVGGPVGDPAVENINTSEVFETIQEAIDDAQTINGNILQVNSSTYIENIIVTKSLTIRGIGTGANQPLIDGCGGNGCIIAVNNVTIDNINISNSSKGILSNYSGLTVVNSTFWFDDQGIDCNYTKTFLTNSDYQLYDNTIQNNRFLITTVNDLDGAIVITVSLHYQNHSGMVSIGDFSIIDNSFLLNDSHAFAVSYMDNSIRWLEEGTISIGSFVFSENTIYKKNNGNNGIYFIGSLSHLKNDSVIVDDIIVSSNSVIDQSYAAFYVEQYKAENWGGTTNGVYGGILVTNNNISSSNSCDGFQISQSNIYGFSDDASLTMGDCHIEGNTIVVNDGYAIVFYMDDVGYQLQDSSSVVVGQVNVSSNDLTAGNGLLIEYYECGDLLTQEANCSLGTLRITDNIIDSTENGVYLQQFSYLGFELSGNAKFLLGDIHIDNNQIESGVYGIYFSQLLLGENLSGSSVCTYGDLTFSDNHVTSGEDGIILINNDSSFRLGNSMSESSIVSMHDIEVSRNTIRDSTSGVFIGPCLFGGENHNLDLDSFKISNNSISFCSIGLNIQGFSISSWCQSEIKNNTIDNCSIGINLSSSYNNLIYNNFFDNNQNAVDDTENYWNIVKTPGQNIIGGPYLGGNYWSDYLGIDGDNDTLGDTRLPYNSQGNISSDGDLHPLTLISGNLTLTQPTDFIATVVGLTRIDLSWQKGIHAVYTMIRQKAGEYPTSSSDGDLLYNGTGVTCSNTSLSPGVHYYFRAWSWNNTTMLWSTDYASVSNTTWVPQAPNGFTATVVGSKQIILQWNKGNYADYTRIQVNTVGYPSSISDGIPVYNGTGSSYEHSNLSANMTYNYSAWSWNTSDKTWSPAYVTASNSTWPGPFAPQGISATTISTNRIDLSWTKGFRATHTRVMQKTGEYPLSVSDGSLVYNGTGSSCSNSSLTPGMRYYFRAWSWNSSSGLWSTTNGSGSNRTWIIPFAPTAFSALTVDTDEISLSWSKGTYATHTRIQRNTGGYPEDINDGVTVYNGTSNIFLDTSLSQDTRYYYRAWSWNATSHLSSSTNASTNATTFSLPLPPTGLTATTIAIDQINLTWTKGTHAVYTIVIQKTTNFPVSIADGDVVYNGTGNESSSSSLILGTRYYFRAWSWNDTSGIWSEANSSTYNITAPFAPTSFTPSVISTNQINLIWTKGTYANYTQVQRKTGSYPQNISDGVTVYNGTNSSVSVTGLSPGTLYYFRAWSWNSTLGVWSITYASAQATTQSDSGGGEETPPPAEGEAPTAEAGGPYSGYVNQTITFNAGLSSDDVQIVGYRWDWTNDGTWDTNWLVLSKTTHVYTTPGNYTVNLQVQDAEDLRDNDTAIVGVITGNSQQQAPVADAAGPYHGLTYQNILFNGSRSYALNTNIVNYTWVFGDGTYGYGVLPIHSYESAGTFTVILTVTDSNTLQAIDTTLATIVLDANKNNISDVIDEAIGSDITSDDLRTVTIDGVLYYLVDTDHDGKSDAFYNPITNTKTLLGMQDDKQLIDLDGDGKWDYVYDPALGVTEPYVEIVTPLNTPWLSITISVVIFVVILLIVWLYKTGRV